MRKPKLIGEVVALSGAFTGQYVVKLYRYPSGRRLPEDRLIVEDGKPFVSRLVALEVLGSYSRGIVTVGQAKLAPERPATLATAPRERTVDAIVTPNHALDHDGERRIIRRKKVKKLTRKEIRASLPVITKMADPSPRVIRRDEQQRALDTLIEVGLCKVTRCPDGARQWDSKW